MDVGGHVGRLMDGRVCGLRTHGRMGSVAGGWVMMDRQTGGRVGVWIWDGRTRGARVDVGRQVGGLPDGRVCGFRTDGRMDVMVGGWVLVDGQTVGREVDGRIDG